MLARVSARVLEALGNLRDADEQDISRLMMKEMLLEAAADATSKVPALARVPGSAVIDYGVNLLGAFSGIPGAALAMSTEGISVLSERRKWIH